MSKLRLAGVIKESIVDGPGIRFVVFGQGCPHRCPGCQNPQTHDFSGGYDTTTERLLAEIRKNPMLKGITLSGGDPFVQPEAMAELAEEAHKLGLNVVTYTGYTIEELLNGLEGHPGWRRLLEQSDTLVDGRFILEQKSMLLKFRGSKNQRNTAVRAGSTRFAYKFRLQKPRADGVPAARKVRRCRKLDNEHSCSKQISFSPRKV